MSNFYTVKDLQIVAKRNPGGFFTRHSAAVWVGLAHGSQGYPEVQSLEPHVGLLVRPNGKTAFRMVVAKEAVGTGTPDAHIQEVRYNCYRPRDGGVSVDEQSTIHPADVIAYLKRNGYLQEKSFAKLELFITQVMHHELKIKTFRDMMGFWQKCINFDRHYHQNDTSNWRFSRDNHVEMTTRAKNHPVCKEMMIRNNVSFYPGIITTI